MNLNLEVLGSKLLDHLVNQYAYDTAKEWHDKLMADIPGNPCPWVSNNYWQWRRRYQLAERRAVLSERVTEFMNALVVTVHDRAWRGVLYDFRVYEEVTVRSSRSKGMVSYELYYVLQHTVTNFDAMHVCREALENGIVQALLELWKVVDKECIGSLLLGATKCGRYMWAS